MVFSSNPLRLPWDDQELIHSSRGHARCQKKQTRNRDVGKRQKLCSYWGAKQQKIDGHLMAYVWHALVQTYWTKVDSRKILPIYDIFLCLLWQPGFNVYLPSPCNTHTHIPMLNDQIWIRKWCLPSKFPSEVAFGQELSEWQHSPTVVVLECHRSKL